MKVNHNGKKKEKKNNNNNSSSKNNNIKKATGKNAEMQVAKQNNTNANMDQRADKK